MDQTQLISNDPLRWPQTPQRTDDAVRRKVAEKLLAEIKSWLGGENTETDEELTSQIAEGLDHYDWDGFALAKEFERNHWDGDAELVDILSGADSHFYHVRDAMLDEWIKEHNVQPKFKTGDEVLIREGDPGINTERRSDKGRVYRGVIDAIRGHSYTVTIAELGHVRSDDPAGPRMNRTIGSVFRWDYVENSDAACRT